jgi:hypothetical protein
MGESDSDMFQIAASWLAKFFALTTFVLIAVWAGAENTDEGWAGGLNNSDHGSIKYRNYHPVLMSLSMFLSLTLSITQFKVTFLPHGVNKGIHGFLHAFSLACWIAGVRVMYSWKKDQQNDNGEDIYYSQTFSWHAWTGIIALSMWSLNFVMGICAFSLPMMSEDMKATMLTYHSALGKTTFIVGYAAMAIGLGGNLKSIDGGDACRGGFASSDFKDTTSAKYQYDYFGDNKLYGCRTAQSAFVTAAITMLLVIVALERPKGGSKAMASSSSGV